MAWDRKVDLPRGFAYVEFEKHDDAEKARISMDGVSDRIYSPAIFFKKVNAYFCYRDKLMVMWLLLASF